MLSQAINKTIKKGNLMQMLILANTWEDSFRSTTVAMS